MQQDNNIENKLRQLDDELQPDLGNMDAHWQQMQAMLQLVALPVKKGVPKWMLNALCVVAVIVLVGGAFLYLSKGKKGNDIAIVQNSVTAPGSINNAMPLFNKDSVETAISATTIADAVQYEDQRNGNADFFPGDSSSFFSDSLKINFTPCDACPSKKVDSGIVTAANRKMMLDNLFEQLKKEEQKFIVDNSRDTLLQFEEGTGLLIPANSFGGVNEIELTAKEFYKKSDIVLNQLNTASNKEQLVTGGMLHLLARYKGNEVKVDKEKPLLLFMPDTGTRMEGMQLFYGEQASKKVAAESDLPGEINDSSADKNINWVAQSKRFSRQNSITYVKVLNLVNMPYEVNEKRGKKTAFFLIDENVQLSRDEIKRALKEKYGYDKIKLRNAEWWEVHDRTLTWAEKGTGYFNSFYATKIGDSMWMDKGIADKYQLAGTSTRTEPVGDYYMPLSYQGYLLAPDILEQQFSKLSLSAARDLQNRYAVDLSQLGWINCDRFYSDSRKKIQYKVDLGDSATNYYTMLLFSKINSMMTGYVNGTKVMFQNIPEGEPVKIISIGINKKGETVYSLTNTTTSDQELTGLQFETVSAPDLKAALSKMDQ